jgi:UDPglucose--hexose-1-phosphate uridylyltransferase
VTEYTAPQRMWMSDRRELFYFDDKPGPLRLGTDLRKLPVDEPYAEMRHDPVADEWVAVASHRQARTHLPTTADCPLCPSTPDRLSEVPADDYDVVVFQNRFPSFGTSARSTSPRGLVATRPAAGRCEVVCFTAEHTGSFSRLDATRLRTVARAWIHRTADLSGVDDVEYVLCFENRGKEIGVTLEHPHGQIYAYPFVPPKVRQALNSARAWRAQRGGCLFCALTADELRAGERVVLRREHAVAYVPAAARWPFEVSVHPVRHVPDLAALRPAELDDLMAVHAEVLARFDNLFDTPTPYIAACYQAPVRADRDLAHLHLQVTSPRRAENKLKHLAGSESAAGVFINDIAPETAASMLRSAGS